MQGVLAREREEHAHLVSSLRAMIASLQSSGDTESQLRSQLISLAEKVAVLTAAQVMLVIMDCAQYTIQKHCNNLGDHGSWLLFADSWEWSRISLDCS